MNGIVKDHLEDGIKVTEMARNIYFIGTAGSGKSLMVATFQGWLGDQGLDSIIVNMDPGAENLAYTPEVDVRDWIKLEEVMDEYGLGPNGAQVMCADLIALNVNEITEVLEKYRTNYIFFDTPGQLELFTFRESSRAIVEAFGKEDSFIVFLMDSVLAKTPNGVANNAQRHHPVQVLPPPDEYNIQVRPPDCGGARRGTPEVARPLQAERRHRRK